jgi:DNA polymerase-1
MILEYRTLAKLKNTYVDKLPSLIDPRTHRLHASFNQTITATGRLSSSNPNLQNIPARTELGRKIRAAFVPAKKGDCILSADYSQIELRLLAHFSNDEAMRAAFAADQDIHRFVASQIYNVPLDKVTGEMRSRCKTVNFGIIYGQGAQGLARTIHISPAEAKQSSGFAATARSGRSSTSASRGLAGLATRKRFSAVSAKSWTSRARTPAAEPRRNDSLSTR